MNQARRTRLPRTAEVPTITSPRQADIALRLTLPGGERVTLLEGERTLTLWRLMIFDRPVGPWRGCVRRTQEDAIHDGLGARDEWGSFYVTVPAWIQRVSMPV